MQGTPVGLQNVSSQTMIVTMTRKMTGGSEETVG